MRSLAGVALSALLTVVAADLGLQRLQPIPRELPSVADGLVELSRPGPDILVFGSSHTRAFRPLKEELNRRSGRERATIVTMEGGWAVSFEWAFRHRIAPILDERDSGGRLLRPNVSRVVIPITFLDLCGDNDHTNIPRNAWNAGDFADDVATNGISEYNRSFIPPLVHRGLRRSLLARRGLNVIDAAKAKLRSDAANAVANAAYVRNLHDAYVVAMARCPAPDELTALGQILDEVKRRGIEATVIMFPLAPITLDGPSDPVLAKYHTIMAGVAQRHGVRVLDWVVSSPVGDADFMVDLDHASADGAAKLMSWALADQLAFLSEAREAREAQEAQETRGAAP